MNWYDSTNVCVFGGAGFVGSNLVKKLVENNAIVTVFDDFSTGSMDNLKEVLGKISVIKDTVENFDAVNHYMDKKDVVFNLAARNIVMSTQNPQDDYSTNIGGMLNILMASRRHKISRIVYTSSASIYGNARYLPINEDDQINLLTPYAVSKFAGEGYCMAFNESYGTPVAVLRLSNVYGTNQRPENPYCGVVAKFMQTALEEKTIRIHGDGLQTRDFTYVRDVVEALMIAGYSNKAIGEIFNIATGIETSIIELAQIIGGFAMLFGQAEHINRRDIDNIRRRVLNVEKARRKLGWTASTILWDGLYNTWKWFKERDEQ